MYQLDFNGDILSQVRISGKVTFDVRREELYQIDVEDLNGEFTYNELVEEFLSRSFLPLGWGEIALSIASYSSDETTLRQRFHEAQAAGFIYRSESDKERTTVWLHPGSSFEYGYSYKTEEGYFSRTWWILWVDDKFFVQETCGGRDCDGPLQNYKTYFVDENGKFLSEYKEGRTDIDIYAQEMGY